MKLEITKEKVLEAASKCSQAKETLKTLFPEVFEEDIIFKDFEVSVSMNNPVWIGDALAPAGLALKCLGLSAEYRWEVIEHFNYQFIVPKRK